MVNDKLGISSEKKIEGPNFKVWIKENIESINDINC